jgi:hypothetical protein
MDRIAKADQKLSESRYHQLFCDQRARDLTQAKNDLEDATVAARETSGAQTKARHVFLAELDERASAEQSRAQQEQMETMQLRKASRERGAQIRTGQEDLPNPAEKPEIAQLAYDDEDNSAVMMRDMMRSGTDWVWLTRERVNNLNHRIASRCTPSSAGAGQASSVQQDANRCQAEERQLDDAGGELAAAEAAKIVSSPISNRPKIPPAERELEGFGVPELSASANRKTMSPAESAQQLGKAQWHYNSSVQQFADCKNGAEQRTAMNSAVPFQPPSPTVPPHQGASASGTETETAQQYGKTAEPPHSSLTAEESARALEIAITGSVGFWITVGLLACWSSFERQERSTSSETAE